MAHDPVREWDRLSWQCRRGMLEVDIVLQRFLEHHARDLEASELRSFKELLELPDNDLWDLIVGRAEATRPEWHKVIDQLRLA